VPEPRFPPVYAAAFGLVAASLIGGGLSLWWPTRGGDSTANGDLGLALLSGGLALAAGGLVAFAVFVAERRLDAALRESDESRERSSLQLALSTAETLEGANLENRELTNLVLPGKDVKGQQESPLVAR